MLKNVLLWYLAVLLFGSLQAQEKGALVYANSFTQRDSLNDWVMEGAGVVATDSSGMTMYSPDEAGHHVFWCPQELPARFVAEWDVRNLHPEAGLCIVFFAAKGRHGEDIFDPQLTKRTGIFRQYTKGDIDNYHISYYANTPTQKDRPHSHLRKNHGFKKVQAGELGIPPDSEEVHHIRLVKDQGHITMSVDGRMIIDWTDDGKTFGEVLGSGKLGFRQMKWTRMVYRNLRVWELL
ncbi:MAG: DUF1961 family protein [Flavobacteriales bacterium]|nr:DUF1961 family protein [Flavobacteriales bacterium]